MILKNVVKQKLNLNQKYCYNMLLLQAGIILIIFLQWNIHREQYIKKIHEYENKVKAGYEDKKR